MKAYHFLQADMRAGSGHEPPWKIGEKREIEGEIALCERGYHSSRTWYDALQYAPGPVACIVEVSGQIECCADKQVSQTRKLLQAVNVDRELRLFACECAERALKRLNVTDERNWRVIAVSRQYAGGQASKEDLAVARAAVVEACSRVEAVVEAGRAAAWDAAKWAARDAAWDAAKDAEIRWQKRRLNRYMQEAFNRCEEIV